MEELELELAHQFKLFKIIHESSYTNVCIENNS